MRSERLAWLDLFRGVAAMVVVAFHFNWQMQLPAVRFGPLAVDLFFVLSGIVLGRKYDREIRAGLPFLAFARARLRRLYPMVLIVVSLIVLMALAGLPELPWSQASAGTVGALLFLVPYSPQFGHGGALFPADGPAWSLWAELAANVVWFLALRAGRRATLILFASAMLAFLALKTGLAGAHWRSDESGWPNMVAALVRALAWFGVGYWISMRRPAPFLPNWLALLLLALSCAAVQRHWLPAALADLGVIVSGTILLVGLMHSEPGSPTMRRLAGLMGLLSYPLYLIHMPASRLAAALAEHGLQRSVAYASTFLVVGAAAAALNEWCVRRLPHRPAWGAATVRAPL